MGGSSMKKVIKSSSSMKTAGPKSKTTVSSKSFTPKATSICERGITHGYSDPLRNYSGSYVDKPNKTTPKDSSPTIAKVTRQASGGHIPKRDPRTKELIFPDADDFRPNLTPAEVILLGSFGGTYFRDIYSETTKKVHNGNVEYKKIPNADSSWWKNGERLKAIEGVNMPQYNTVSFSPTTFLTSDFYDKTHNRFKVSCGGSLDMWESKNWINPLDPYGWFQWYCWYYNGRRSTDDARQIARWKGVASLKSGRFRIQLLNGCAKKSARKDDPKISPVIRQTLQHWGVDVR